MMHAHIRPGVCEDTENTHQPSPMGTQPRAAAIRPSLPTERHGYAPPPGRRWLALAGTTVIFAAAVVGLFVTFESAPPPPPPVSVPLVVMPLAPASPPEIPPEAKIAPKPVEKHERRPTPPRVQPIDRTPVPLATIAAPPPAPAVKLVDPAPPQPETTTPRTAPAQPAPQPASNAPDSWEGRVLARLEKYRRYPGAARSAHSQGVVYIRFRLNRDGHVLSSSLVRGSGYPALDQAALDTLRRADPLPKIPNDRPDEAEIVVPVEFTIH